jgi:hypothetical protein
MVDNINAQLIQMMNKRFHLVDAFATVFPALHEQIIPYLRALHKESDYDIDNIPSRFSMGWQFLMLSTPMSLEAVNSQVLRDQQRTMQARWDEALEEARMLLRETCLNLVTHLRESLSNDTWGAPKRLSTSTVTNLREFFAKFNMRDITNDRQLAEIVECGRNLLNGANVESLRTMDGVRTRFRTELQSIEQAVTETIQIAPTRRIRVRE